jgi:tetratricopeptide (TPR) repeat protein
MKKNRNVLAGLLVVLLFVGCTNSTDLEMRRGERALSAGDYEKAVHHFRRVMKSEPSEARGLKAAEDAAQAALFELKDFKLALSLYKHVVVHSSDREQMLKAQRKIAEIVFSHLGDYEQAVREYHRLLELPHSPEEEMEYRLALARSYFFLNNFYQSQVEIDQIIKDRPRDNPENFAALLLRANILVSTKKTDEAIEAFTELTQLFPEKSNEEQIYLNLALCYEEKKDFDKAIEILTAALDHYPTPEFLKLRIQRLEVRKSLLPGASGRLKR